MKFGLFFVFQNPESKTESQVIGEALEQIQYAEELGYDAVWVAEHHFTRHGICGDPLQLLTYVAARTKRIRLGLAVSILPFHQPILMAEQAALLDIVSNGRLDFGVGRGYLEPEFRGLGLSMEHSTTMFRESLEIIRLAWSEDRISYQGEHYRLEDLRVAPKPIQRPHPPIFVASVSPPSVSWAAAQGLRIMSGAVTPYQDLKVLRKHYREELVKNGHAPSLYADCPLQRNVFVAESTAEARKLAAPALEWAAATAVRSGNSAQGGTYSADYQYYEKIDTLRRERASAKWTDAAWADMESTPIVGDPDEVRRRLQAVQTAMDLGYLMAWMSFGGIDHELTKRSMTLFAREVAPHFRNATDAKIATAAPTSTVE